MSDSVEDVCSGPENHVNVRAAADGECEWCADIAAARADGVREAEERFQKLIPVLLTWKENMPTEVELAYAREHLRAAGITPEFLAGLMTPTPLPETPEDPP